MMLAIILATSTILLVNLSRDDLRTRRSMQTAAVLAEARNALIDFAIVNLQVDPGRSVRLPCPDIDDSGGFPEGASHTTACGASGETVMGRLPWRTLGIAAGKDAGSACLWYVVSGSYKDAGTSSSPMINTDTNGQLQLYAVETGNIVAGLAAEDRPVAMVIAAMPPVSGQSRPGSASSLQCAPAAAASRYLETDVASGISNATLNGIPDAIDTFAKTSGESQYHNDRIVTVSRRDIELRLLRQQGFRDRMRNLGLALASCLANYAATNPAGINDKRLVWPALVSMTDYRPDSAYDDANTGFQSGRLPDIVDDSNTATSNPIPRVLSDCDTSAVPQWTPAMMAAWRNWKDHFFYAVSDAHVPTAPTPSSCGSCLTVNGTGQYAAVLLYSNTRLNVLGQIRNEPPIDSDSKGDPGNYLEGGNATNIPGDGALSDYVSGPETASFNDLLFCIDDQLLVTEC